MYSTAEFVCLMVSVFVAHDPRRLLYVLARSIHLSTVSGAALRLLAVDVQFTAVFITRFNC